MPSRPYQTSLVYEISKAFSRGQKRLIVQLPTGGGKTRIASELVARANAKRILYVVPSNEILEQTSRSLKRERVPHTLLVAGARPDLSAVSCLLAMSQTLARRLDVGMFAQWKPDLIIVDEAHKLIEQHRKVLNRWPCPVVGFTATPVRLDGKPLAALWPFLVCGPTIRSLQRQSFLVPCRTVNAFMPDLSKVRRRKNDFDQQDLDRAYSAEAVVREAPSWWLRYAKGKRTIAFTPGIESSKRFLAAYRARGIRCEHVDGSTTESVRNAALERLRRNQIDVLFNCSLFVEGLDLVELGCVQLLTATSSLARFMQQVGRGLRVSPGKRELLLLDHGGNTARHGRVDADRDWYDGGKSLEDGHKTCLCCGTVIELDRSLCPSCYRKPEPRRAVRSVTREAREERALSRATPPRPCPAWAFSVARIWSEQEQARHANGAPLSEPARYCRRILRQQESKG